MRFILVKCAGREEEFPDHVQYRATCGETAVDLFFWVHGSNADADARALVRKHYPDAYFSDEKVH